jgi:hypothetical protein
MQKLELFNHVMNILLFFTNCTQSISRKLIDFHVLLISAVLVAWISEAQQVSVDDLLDTFCTVFHSSCFESYNLVNFG